MWDAYESIQRLKQWMERKIHYGEVLHDYGVLGEHRDGYDLTRVELLLCRRKGLPRLVFRSSVGESLRYPSVRVTRAMADGLAKVVSDVRKLADGEPLSPHDDSTEDRVDRLAADDASEPPWPRQTGKVLGWAVGVASKMLGGDNAPRTEVIRTYGVLGELDGESQIALWLCRHLGQFQLVVVAHNENSKDFTATPSSELTHPPTRFAPPLNYNSEMSSGFSIDMGSWTLGNEKTISIDIHSFSVDISPNTADTLSAALQDIRQMFGESKPGKGVITNAIRLSRVLQNQDIKDAVADMTS